MSDFRQTRTELHTHLMGMLSADNFFRLLAKYSDTIYWPMNKAIDENTTYISIREIPSYSLAKEAIAIPLGKKRDYEEGLRDIYRNRTGLLSYIIENYSLKNGISIEEAKYKIYNNYFNVALRELMHSGVKYVEISFANEDIISHLKPSVSDDKIQYRFLLCTQRTNSVGPTMQEKIKRAYENGVAIGFDIMGMETPIDADELKKTGKRSFYKKLDALIKVLINYQNSVLRIHSGEAIGTEENTEKIFRIIDDIKQENGYKDFPPPELRIGHGVHYNKTEYYYEFLRKNNVIVEINATSNLALSNISSMDELPYIDYLNHGINIAISTDGHGAYSTNTILEDKIALLEYLKNETPEGYDKIVDFESDYLDKKVSK